jgi:DNA-binding GntR family transcriptional regulator
MLFHHRVAILVDVEVVNGCVGESGRVFARSFAHLGVRVVLKRNTTPFEHEQILVALKASDADSAHAAIRYHVQAVNSPILERFQ